MLIYNKINSNGYGNPYVAIEIKDKIYINGNAYNKAKLSPIPFEYLKIGSGINGYTTNSYDGLSFNKVCPLYKDYRQYIDYSASPSNLGCGYIVDKNDNNIVYILVNKLYANGYGQLYVLNTSTNNIEGVYYSYLNDANYSFAGQDDRYVYMYVLGCHTQYYYAGGILIFDKVKKTFMLKNKINTQSPDTVLNYSGGITYNNYTYGFRIFDNSQDEMVIINTISKPGGTDIANSLPFNKFYYQVVKNGECYENTGDNNYNSDRSPDGSIEEFRYVSFSLNGYTKETSYSKNEFLIPFFSRRSKDLEYENYLTFTNQYTIKVASFIKDTVSNKMLFYKEYPLNIKEYCDLNEGFLDYYESMINYLQQRYLQVNVEYLTLNGKKLMIWIFENTNYNKSNNTTYNGIAVFEITSTEIVLKSYTKGSTGYAWSGHLMNNDMSTIYQGIDNIGVNIYSLDETELTYKLISSIQVPGLLEIAMDTAENLYTLTRDIRCERTSVFDSIALEAKFASDNYKWEGNPIKTYVLVNAKNMRGEPIVSSKTLILNGNCIFEDGTKEKIVNTGLNIKIPVTITGSGFYDVDIN